VQPGGAGDPDRTRTRNSHACTPPDAPCGPGPSGSRPAIESARGRAAMVVPPYTWTCPPSFRGGMAAPAWSPGVVDHVGRQRAGEPTTAEPQRAPDATTLPRPRCGEEQRIGAPRPNRSLNARPPGWQRRPGDQRGQHHAYLKAAVARAASNAPKQDRVNPYQRPDRLPGPQQPASRLSPAPDSPLSPPGRPAGGIACLHTQTILQPRRSNATLVAPQIHSPPG